MDVPLPVKEDSPLDPAAVRKRLQTVLEWAEYNRLHYGLRHTFATTALQNGVHVRTVSSMPGHYDTGFTLRTYPPHCEAEAGRGCSNHGRLYGASHVKRNGKEKRKRTG